jgi:hypothetical protein
MKSIKYIILTLGIMAGFGMTVLPATSVAAANVFPTCEEAPDDPLCKDVNPNSLGDFIKTIVNTLLYVLGAVSVVTIIVAGIRYTTSQGDPGAVKTAKDTLLYAVIGLIVAMMSYAIVNFVAETFFKAPKEEEKTSLVVNVLV